MVDAGLRGLTVVPDHVTDEGELRGDAVLGSTAEAGTTPQRGPSNI